MVCEVCGWKEPPFIGRRCYSCNFWKPFVWHKHGIRFERVHYVIHGDLEYGRRGYAGTWEFCMKDGRVLISENVTCQGGIPERFAALLPDNAYSMRTTWRGQHEMPQSPGFGNPVGLLTPEYEIEQGKILPDHPIYIGRPKPAIQGSLF